MAQDTERFSSLMYSFRHDFFYVKLSVMSKLRDMDMKDLQSAVGVIVSKNIIHLVVIVLAPTWFITYIYYWNLQFSNIVIINKSQFYLTKAYVTILVILFRSFGLLTPNIIYIKI